MPVPANEEQMVAGPDATWGSHLDQNGSSKEELCALYGQGSTKTLAE